MPNSSAKFVPFSPLSKREIIISLSFIERTDRFRFVDICCRFSYYRCVRLHGPTLIELIKHDIPLEQNNTELIKIQLNASEYSSSPRAQSFKSEAVMRGFEHTFPDSKHFLSLKAFKIKTVFHNFHRKLEQRWLTFVCWIRRTKHEWNRLTATQYIKLVNQLLYTTIV